LLLVAVGGVSWEALRRFATPEPIPGLTVLVVAAIGVAINGASAALFLRGAHSDANLRGAFLHLLADAAVSVGVVLVGLALLFYPDWLWLDPLVSLVISGVVAWGTWGLLRTAIHLTLDGVPRQLDLSKIRVCLEQLPGVTAVHDLHVWAISTSETALTAHLVVAEQTPLGLAGRASRELQERFGIAHSTIQLDSPTDAQDCHSC
jgi:cobalt-zinc-cadmium efflux system protein